MNSPRKPSGVHATVPARPRDPFGHQGKVLAGRYRLDALLGSGGMAEVYAATHLRLGMPLAVKVLRSSSATSPNLMDRFAQEAKATARLQHENIVRILDYGSEGSAGVHRDGAAGGGDALLSYRRRRAPAAAHRESDPRAAVRRAERRPPRRGRASGPQARQCDARSRARRRELIKVLDFGLARITEVGPSRRPRQGRSRGHPNT
ncbi:MAG: hypothetical protein IPG04_36925 [Polyangiaceae bacterium]|nr:hypothetical protein [Polyangiaceae bacterium]